MTDLILKILEGWDSVTLSQNRWEKDQRIYSLIAEKGGRPTGLETRLHIRITPEALEEAQSDTPMRKYLLDIFGGVIDPPEAIPGPLAGDLPDSGAPRPGEKRVP